MTDTLKPVEQAALHLVFRLFYREPDVSVSPSGDIRMAGRKVSNPRKCLIFFASYAAERLAGRKSDDFFREFIKELRGRHVAEKYIQELQLVHLMFVSDIDRSGQKHVCFYEQQYRDRDGDGSTAVSG